MYSFLNFHICRRRFILLLAGMQERQCSIMYVVLPLGRTAHSEVLHLSLQHALPLPGFLLLAPGIWSKLKLYSTSGNWRVE